MIIAFASGKGGTGKTTVSTNLAWVLGQSRPVQYVDCDVEEPNGHLFFQPRMEQTSPVTIPVPEVDEEVCIHCGGCSRICQFNAISVAPSITLTFPELCHGCGACLLACPTDAIREVPRPVGVVEQGQAQNVSFLHGRMNVGEAMSPPVIRAVKAHIDPQQLTILDAPPGTSCPATTAIQNVNMVVLVGEPTRFGLHDLTLAVELVRSMNLPFGVVINRSDWGDDRLERYCEQQSIPVFGRFPHDRRVAEACARGQLAAAVLPDMYQLYQELGQRMMAEVKV